MKIIEILFNTTVMSKEALSQTIKAWLQLEKEMTALQKELKQRRKKKAELSDSLLQIMKSKDIECFDLNEGKILHVQSKTKTPLNKAHLNKCLTKYFSNKGQVPVDDIVQFILDERQVVLKDGLKHKGT